LKGCAVADQVDPWRLLAALAAAEGELMVYAGDVDSLPEGARPEITRETVRTESVPDGYGIIVIRYQQR
jgi:hypothetical protein